MVVDDIVVATGPRDTRNSDHSRSSEIHAMVKDLGISPGCLNATKVALDCPIDNDTLMTRTAPTNTSFTSNYCTFFASSNLS